MTSLSGVSEAGPMTQRLLSRLTIAGQALFWVTWLVAGPIEGDGYSGTRHDISDLSALTAQHAGLVRLSTGTAGALTVAFALFALRPSVDVPGRKSAFGAWLVAFSLPGLDDLSDAFFRLDCRQVDVGCTTADATASWHGKVHVAVFIVAALATVVAPFALARRMRHIDGWRDVARPAWLFGWATIAMLALALVTTGTSVMGSTQRIAATVIPLGVVGLALRVDRLSAAPDVELRVR
jgi:hypothetical protein